MAAPLEIIQEILTRRLQPGDINRIVATVVGQRNRDDDLLAVTDVLRHVAELLQISSRLLDNLLLLMIEITTRMLHAERATLFMRDPETGELFSRVAQGDAVREIRFAADQGIAGTVLRTGQTLFIADAYADPRFNAEIDKQTGYRTRNIVAAPIRVSPDEDIIGVLELLNLQRAELGADDRRLLEVITAQAAMALANAQSFELAQQARETETCMQEVTAAISSELKLKPLLEKILESVILILNCERSTLFLHDEKTDELWSQVALGLGTQEIRFKSNLGIAGQVFTTGETINIADAYADPRFNPAVDKKTGFHTRNILCMPVINRSGKTIGVTQVLNKKDGVFTRLDERKLRTFSAQASIAIENAKLFNEVLNMKNYNESILESLSNGVISVNVSRKIEKVNLSALKTWGLEREAIMGRFADIFFTGDNHFIVDSLRRVIATNEPDMFFDTEIVRPSGQRVSVNVAVAPLRDSQNQPMGGLLVFEDLTSEKRIKGTLARYMTKEVAEQLLNSEAELGGKMQEATILFSDIRNFTTISEKLGPQETVAMLNEYFTTMVDIVFHHGGILDKFIGDAMLGVFGAPFASGEDPDHAVTTAVEMLKALRLFNKQRSAKGQQTIEIGVGINTDVVLVGNIGSMKRMDYTVIGDGVNLASRLEGANKFYGTGILVTENTFKQLNYRYRSRDVDLIQVKGKTHPVKIHEILDHYDVASFPALEQVIGRFNEGVAAYRHRDFSAGLAAFSEVLGLHPGDQLARLYVERCRKFITAPPPPDWDGVWVMTSKS